MACEVLNINFTQEQRQAYLDMYAALVLNKIGAAIKEGDQEFPLNKAFYRNISKEWIRGRCCGFYLKPNSKEPTTFLDFMELVKSDRGFFFPFSRNMNDDENTERIFQVLDIIKKEEYKLAQPILSSIQFNIYKETLHNEEDAFQVSQAMTYLFYFSPMLNPSQHSAYSQLLIKHSMDTGVPFYTWSLFFSCLARQKICPSFTELAAFFTCTECDRTPSAETDPYPQSLIYVQERPTLDLETWLNPTLAALQITGETDKKIIQNLWKLFYSRLPSFEELRNIIFQIGYLYLTLAKYQITVNDFSLADLLIFKCKKIIGYNLYQTVSESFLSPNFGNVVLLSNVPKESFESKQFTSKRIRMNVSSDPTRTNLSEQLVQILGLLGQLVEAWKNKEDEVKLEKDLFYTHPYHYSVKESQEKEAPVPIILLEYDKITRELKNMEDWWTGGGGTTKMGTITEMENFLKTFFTDYIRGEISENVDDLRINESYTLRKAVKVPDFVKEILYGATDLKSSDIYTKYVAAESKGENLIVSSETENLAHALEMMTTKGPSFYLFEKLKTEYGKLLQELNISEAIFDRYEVSVDYLESRKKLRNYGISFLNFLALPSRASRTGMGGTESSLLGGGLEGKESKRGVWGTGDLSDWRTWRTIAQLKNLFTRHTYELLGEKKMGGEQLKKLLWKYLQIDTAADVDKLLSTMIFLSYLSSKGLLEEKKEGMWESKVPPSLTESEWEEKRKEFFDFIAEVLGINPNEMQEYLRFIEGKFGVPKEERFLIEELLRKLLVNDKKQRQKQFNRADLYELESEAESELLENKKQYKFMEVSSKTTTNNDKASSKISKPLNKEELQQKINKKKERLQQLEEQFARITK